MEKKKEQPNGISGRGKDKQHRKKKSHKILMMNKIRNVGTEQSIQNTVGTPRGELPVSTDLRFLSSRLSSRWLDVWSVVLS